MNQGVVRFITAGSVDDGKNTLNGSLLYDTKAILIDLLIALTKTKYARVTAHDAEIDLALLTDGLEAEREQGITIDDAHRFFSTAKRKFIVANAFNVLPTLGSFILIDEATNHTVAAGMIREVLA